MIKITDKKQCCGCTACVSICSHKAIYMENDILGFLYPKVDENKCVNCGLCEKVCAFNENYDKTLNLNKGPISYAVRHKDFSQIETSRSGAAFIALSDWVIENGGIVYGVCFSDHFRVIHKRATTKKERDDFKGSKYVQSDLGDIFLQVRDDLKKGLLVLFSGTPCQTAGLNSYIGKKLRENLILVDIVCHGVPSPYIWRDYITLIEEKYNTVIKKANFRDKSILGWAGHKESFYLKNNKNISCDSFTYLFYEHIMFRESCEVCYYTNLIRPSDITLADFWGWEKSVPHFNKDNKGCSLVFCNTNKGLNLFEKCKKDLICHIVKVEDCLQPNLMHPSTINKKRYLFEKEYAKYGFKYVLKKYSNISFKYKVIALTNKIISKINRLLK